MPYVTIEEEVWVELDDFETDDLVDELKRRKGQTNIDTYLGPSASEIANELYMAKHVRKQPYDHLVDQLLSTVLGKVL